MSSPCSSLQGFVLCVCSSQFPAMLEFECLKTVPLLSSFSPAGNGVKGLLRGTVRREGILPPGSTVPEFSRVFHSDSCVLLESYLDFTLVFRAS